MSANRIVYLNWIADLGHDPGSLRADPGTWAAAEGGSAAKEIGLAVDAAVRALDDNEREFIERYYYMGQSYCEIAAASGRQIHRLEGLRKRAMKKLKRSLAAFVQE